jgi:hypothetical protein
MSDIGNYFLTGGTTGCILGIVFLTYKFCSKKKFHSECCGGKMDVSNDPTEHIVISAPPPTPILSPTPQASRPPSMQL